MLTIGELGHMLQLNPKTIRYYEAVGLLPDPRRGESGYRLYSSKEVERLRLIQRAKLLGLSLAEIKHLLEYAVDGRCSALESQLLQLVSAKLSEVERRVSELTAFKCELERYHDDLLRRLASKPESAVQPTLPAACNCINELEETRDKQSDSSPLLVWKPPAPGAG